MNKSIPNAPSTAPITSRVQFQHFIQARYLCNWTESGGRLNVFEKSTRTRIKHRTHRNSCGANNWQSPELEKAFHHIERAVPKVVGFNAEISGEDASLLTGWLALHHIRTPQNREALAKGYNHEVAKFQHWLSGCGAFFQIFPGKCLMTSDSPICIVPSKDEEGPLDFVIAPLSPNKAIYITPNDKLPALKNSQHWLFSAETLNQVIAHCAWHEIISFDRRLHLP